MSAVPAVSPLRPMLERAREASRRLPEADRDAGLRTIAAALRADRDAILAANARDVAAERGRGTPEARVDRLTLTPERIEAMAAAAESVADLPDPLHRDLAGWRLANGLHVRRVSVPFGVIGIVYESRPNVTVDAAALALKAGSATLLRGSSNALSSNRALADAMRRGLGEAGLPPDALALVDDPDRDRVTELLSARGEVDLVIPRGGASLIDHVVRHAQVPVIETGVGNCHVYVHAGADLDMAQRIVVNAKVQRPGVCNAAETVLVDAAVADAFLPRAVAALEAEGVALVGCERTRAVAPGVGVASDEDWAEEYLDLKLALRVVDDLESAMAHVDAWGSGHSEAIVTNDRAAGRRFQARVDAAAVYVNASTRFTDGFAFGFGAEIGISTQKLHARGPMGLAELTTHKYVVEGDGQIRD